MREYRVNDAWRPRGKNAANGSILSGGTVAGLRVFGNRALMPTL